MSLGSIHSSKSHFLAAVHIFVTRSGMAETTLLKEAGAQKATLKNLREGLGVSSRTLDRVLGFMAGYAASEAGRPECHYAKDDPAGSGWARGWLYHHERAKRSEGAAA